MISVKDLEILIDTSDKLKTNLPIYNIIVYK